LRVSRGRDDRFSTKLLERYQRSDEAFVSALADAVVAHGAEEMQVIIERMKPATPAVEPRRALKGSEEVKPAQRGEMTPGAGVHEVAFSVWLSRELVPLIST